MKQIKKLILSIWMASVVAGCASNTSTPPSVNTQAPVPSATVQVETAAPTATVVAEETASPVAADDIFTQMGITLPAPSCTAVTPSQMEGPYYTSGAPGRNVLYEEGMVGTRMILVGYVLDQNCNPLPNAWLDFWQADANGDYDNQGYRLRGHQFSDAQGRYYLDTVLPGLYLSRPIEHIHVKLRPEGGQEITSQLYFPDRPVDGLTVTLEQRDTYLVGYFNFVLQK